MVETNITKMYTQEIGLTEELAIVEDMILLEKIENQESQILVPDNNAEIFIPLNGNIFIKPIGGIRNIDLNEGSVYFFKPRGRGIEVSLRHANCLLVKVNSIYTKSISEKLKELCNGVFELQMDTSDIKSLIASYKADDVYRASDVVQNLFPDSADLFDYNLTILESVEKIKNTNGTISIKEIYSTLNVSKSKLEQHFNREVGLTPKEFCKIEKINCFINMYREAEGQSLTELTYQCGYYDQSHLIKDFKYFLDSSPKKFLSKR